MILSATAGTPVSAAATAGGLRGLLDVWARLDVSAGTGGRHYLESADGSRTVCYAQLGEGVRRWSALLDQRVSPGGRVAICLQDKLDFAVVELGVLASGRCACPVDPYAPDGQLAALLERLDPELVVTDRSGRGANAFRLEAATALDLPPARHEDTERAPGALLMLTSGTTGRPKGIWLSEQQLLHTATQVVQNQELTTADRCLNPLPLFHINAQVVGLLATLISGGTLVLPDRFSRSGFWSLVVERDITWVNAVPAMLATLSREPMTEPAPLLRFIRSASAALSPAVLARVEHASGAPVLESYGMTEAGSQITANPLAGPRRPGSAGLALGCDLRVVDEHGNTCGTGLSGRVQIRGAGIVTGYLDGEQAERFDRDGWLDTGDVGHRDDDGYLFLEGRADDIINRGGEKVLPREVEDVLLADDDVASAVVVGRPDEVLGAVPVAYVVPAAGVRDHAGLADRLRVQCERALARHERPHTVHVVTSLPLTSTGKVQRHLVGARPGSSSAA